MSRFVSVFWLFFAFSSFVLAGDSVSTNVSGEAANVAKLPDVNIVAGNLPLELSQSDRNYLVLNKESIAASGSYSLPDALESLGMVSSLERGDTIVQSDISIRGSSFQQVLVTLDGLALFDPQTAHHNMDLPFPIEAIEQVTIIPGPGSALFGPAAMAGTVDLSPRVPRSNSGFLRVTAGDFETFRYSFVQDFVSGPFSATFSALSASSDGFMEGTDYEVDSFWGSSIFISEKARLRVSAGKTNKDFGAADFYGDFPSREKTDVMIVDLAPELTIDGWTLKLIARYREHNDEFTLIESDPDFYFNEHNSKVFAEKLVAVSPETAFGSTAFGAERTDSSLESSNLGERGTATTSAFLQHRFGNSEVWMFDAGVRADDHNLWGTEISPSLGASYNISSSFRFRGSVAKGIRPPSFTELYYSDPKNQGNPDLEPETSVGGEAGFEWKINGLKASAVYFKNVSDDAIDWVRTTSSEPWSAQNIGRLESQGTEFGIEWLMGLAMFGINYRYIDQKNDAENLESKYALNVPAHDLGIAARLEPGNGFSASIQARYRDIPELNSYWLLGARIAQKIGKAVLFMSGRNLLDETYVEIPGVPTRPRYVEAGVEINW